MKKVNGIFIFLTTLAIFGIGVESFAKNHFIFSSQPNQPSAYSTIEEYRAEYNALAGNAINSWTRNPPSSLEEARILVENLWTWIGNFRRIFGSGDQTWTGIPWAGTYNNPKTTEIENTPTYAEARQLYYQAYREVGRLKRDYLALGGSEGEWTGTYEDIGRGYEVNTLTLSEAQTLHGELVTEIARLKTEYLNRGGLASAWIGTYDNPDTPDVVEKTPTISEAEILHSGLAVTSKPQALAQLLKKSKSSHSPSSNNHTLIIGLAVGIGGAILLFGGIGYWFYRRH